MSLTSASNRQGVNATALPAMAYLTRSDRAQRGMHMNPPEPVARWTQLHQLSLSSMHQHRMCCGSTQAEQPVDWAAVCGHAHCDTQRWMPQYAR